MNDQNKSKEELINELLGLRQTHNSLKATVEADLLDHQKTELALKASEERFQLLFNNAPLGYQSLDFDGNFIEVNQQWLDTLGYERKEVIGKWFGDFLSPDFKDGFRKRFPIFKELGKIHSEFEMIHKNGKLLFIGFDGRIGYDPEGNFKQTHCILQDITEVRAIEKELLRSREMLKNMEKAAKIGGWVFDVETMVQTWTEEIFHILEIDTTHGAPDVPEGIGFIAPEYQPMALLGIQRAIEFGEPYNQEWEVIAAKGNKRWVTAIATPYQENGKTKTVAGSFQDITERKQAEIALAESEKRYRTLLGNLEAGIVVHAPDTSIVMNNPRASELLGLSNDQMRGKAAIDPAWKFINEDNTPLPPDEYPVSRIARGRQPIKNQVLGIHQPGKNGVVWVTVNGFPVLGNSGEITEIVINFFDITERKLAEVSIQEKSEEIEVQNEEYQEINEELNLTNQELAEAKEIAEKNEARLKMAMEVSRSGAWDWDILKNTFYWSDEFLQLFGLPKNTIAGIDAWTKALHPEDVERASAKIQEAIKNHTELLNDYRIILPNNEIRWIRATGHATYLNNKPVRMIGLCMDISDRKQVEEELKNRENLLNKVFDVLPIGLWFADKNGRLIRGNPAGVKIWGAEPTVSIEEYGVFQARRHPSGQEIEPDDWALAHTVREGVTIVDEQLEIDTFDGQKKIILNYTAPVMDDHGIMQGAIVVNQDITERKQAEEALRESEEKFREMANLLPQIIFESDTKGNLTYVNKNAFEIFGYPLDYPLLGKSSLDFYTTESRLRAIGNISKRIAENPKFESNEYVMIRKDGSTFPALVYSNPIIKEGKPVGLRGIIVNITERKQAEEEIKKTGLHYQALIEKAPDGIALVDVEGKFKYISPAAKKMFGYMQTDEVFGSPDQYTHPDDLPMVLTELGKTFEDPAYIPTLEYRISDKLGHWRWVETTFSNLLANPSVESIVLNFRDITDRKQLEEVRTFLSTSGYPGSDENFFESLAKYLAEILDSEYVCIDKLEGDGLTAQTVAIYNEGQFEPNVSYTLKQTPCGDVVGKTICCFPENVCQLFPHDQALQDLKAHSYIGTTLWSFEGKPIGLIAIIGQKPLKNAVLAENILKLVAIRAAGELERLTAEEKTRLANEQAVESEDFFHSIFENSPVGKSITGLDGSLKTNKAFSDMLGYSFEEFQTKNFIDITHPDDIQKSLDTVEALLKGEDPVIQFEKKYIHKNGSVIDAHVVTTLQKSRIGEPLFFITSVTDITQRKQAEKALKESEERFKNMFERHSSIMLLVEPESGMITGANEASARFYGYSKAELVAMRIDEINLLSPEQVKKERELAMLAERNYFVFPHKLANGEVRMVEVHSSPIVFQDRQILFSIIHDITERKHLEKIHEIQFNIATAVVTSDNVEQLLEFVRTQLSQIVDTTNFFAALYNAKNNTLKKLHWVDEVDNFEEWDATKSFSGYVVKTGKTLLLNKQEIAKLGAEQNIQIIGTPAECWLGVPLVVNKKAIGVLVMQSYTNPKAYDTSSAMLFEQVANNLSVYIEKSRILQHLKLAKEQAEESDRLKSAFLANMSHEIRTPMNGILGFAELLKTPGLSGDQQQQYIKIIEKSGARMLNIINDIVDISKIEAGLMKAEITESNINEQIEYIYTFFKPEVEAKGMKISFRNPLPAKEAFFKTDREKLFAILTNLVKNAIKYTNEGSIEFGYDIVVKTDNYPSLRFFVKDTGIGIPQDRQDAIFERFIQADVTDKMALQGAGLGLSITKAYVEMLGGKIWVESRKGVGSIFYFTLPYRAEPVIKPVDQQFAPSGKTDHVRKLKILIAEDDEASEMLIDLIVKTFCKELLKVGTGIEAVEACRNNPDIDLVLMDIRMPEMDGYNATKQIRKFNQKVVIIAQTAYGLSGDKEKSIESGCNDYISKPINKDELLALIQLYFGK